MSSEAIDFLIQLEVTIDNIDSETKRPDGTYEHTCDKCKCVWPGKVFQRHLLFQSFSS